jgi:glycosyltransferase involved in cell wall biosynthesis/GT2 family glycosyltransferase
MDPTSQFCFSAHRPRSISKSAGVPFYIFAPDYTETSGGIRVLHYLCHILNELGEEAYVINAREISKSIRAPQLTYAKLEEHYVSGKNPVTIYPEIIHANPTSTPLIVRWLLNIPGHLGKPIEFEENDLIFFYEAWCLPKGMDGAPLFIHPVVDAVFNNEDNPDDTQRELECYYANKYHLGRKPILPEHKHLVSLGQEIKRTPEEIAGILRKSKVLYCYEPSGIISEAQACGCPVLLIRSSYFPLPDDDTHHQIPGLAIYGDENAYEKAANTLPLISERHRRNRANSWEMAIGLIEKVYAAHTSLEANGKPLLNSGQKLWALPKSERPSALDQLKDYYLGTGLYFKDIDGQERVTPSLEQAYVKRSVVSKSQLDRAHQSWLDKRGFIQTDTLFIDYPKQSNALLTSQFHLLIRLNQGEVSLLADTLDALALQITDQWILDVVTELPSPDGIEDVPNVRWHTVPSLDQAKWKIDNLVAASSCNWIIELPAGVRPDVLYLVRLNKEAERSPNAVAFYVDDDCCDESDVRFSPRYKPALNPSYLQATDLAGPLCVSRQAWVSSGGASQTSCSPWYDQLIRIADTHGWQSIVHIPDMLLTYFKSFPSDIESCINVLNTSLKCKEVPAEALHLTHDSWEIRYSPAEFPAISIAVLSQGQLEFITRCVSSLIKVTRYRDFEILIVTQAIEGDPDYQDWLAAIQERTDTPRIRVLFAESGSSYTALCNQAMAAAANDWVVLLREEVVIVQDQWLEELARLTLLREVAAVSPLIHHPGNAHIAVSGSVLGLMGEFGSPYASSAALGDAGYLDYLKVTRDVAAPPSSCLLVRKASFEEVGGMDASAYGNEFGEIDLSLKFRSIGMRILVHPRSSVVFGGETSLYDLGCRLESLSKKRESSRALRRRWGSQALKDPYWNPNLSLSSSTPIPETEFRAQWQYMPCDKPRILAHPLGNGQGDFRVTSPLTAVRKAGLAMECVWRQKISSMARYFTAAEIAQMAPTTVIIQNYIHDIALAALDDWHASSDRPFIVYTLDDLINDLDVTNPFRKHIPPNSRSRFKYALERCDRLVLSTEYLADTYRHFISDIRVVPNRLEKEVWLPLVSERRTAPKPRVGWAGGTTHQGDLILLKEIIEQTRNEVDWVFFGMCPDELRPLIADFHDLVPFDEYPARLATLNLDIAVAPLAITDFNRGKSNLRLLEYGALGIPVVCTDIDPYQNSPACRVQNKASEWVEALRERINDPEAREREGNTMRDWVHRNFLLEDHLDQWLAAHLPG